MNSMHPDRWSVAEELTVRHFIEYIGQCILRNQWKCIEYIGSDFEKNVIPVFVQEKIRCIAQKRIAIV